jgi:hypothetical protein
MVDKSFVEICTKGPEVFIYLAIQAYGDTLKEPKASSIKELLVQHRLKSQYNYLLEQTKRFGIITAIKNGKPTESFLKWKAWWKKYIDNLSNEDFDNLLYDLSRGGELKQWYPKGSWLD